MQKRLIALFFFLGVLPVSYTLLYANNSLERHKAIAIRSRILFENPVDRNTLKAWRHLLGSAERFMIDYPDFDFDFEAYSEKKRMELFADEVEVIAPIIISILESKTLSVASQGELRKIHFHAPEYLDKIQFYLESSVHTRPKVKKSAPLRQRLYRKK